MVPVFESPNLILTGWFSPLCSRRFINRDQKPFFLKNVILTFLWSENLYPVHPYRKAPSGALMSTPMTIEYNMSQFLSFLFTSLVSWKEVGCSRCIKGTVLTRLRQAYWYFFTQMAEASLLSSRSCDVCQGGSCSMHSMQQLCKYSTGMHYGRLPGSGSRSKNRQKMHQKMHKLEEKHLFKILIYFFK